MNCPVDGARLEMADRQGVEIDYCPRCHGIWLDRGELDKLVDRLATADRRWERAHTRAQYSQRGDGGYFRRERRQGILGELFDFD